MKSLILTPLLMLAGLLGQTDALIPPFPKYKSEALQLFFGDEQRFVKVVSPFSKHKYDTTRWNYVERNYQKPDKQTVPTPLKRHQDHKGNFIATEILHNSTSGLIVKATADQVGDGTSLDLSIDKPASNTGNGFIPICLGFVYGMQQNTRNPGLCYETIELDLLVIDEALALIS